MNHYPMWKNLLVLGVVAFAVVFALPNLFGDDPAIQVSRNNGEAVTDTLPARLEATLENAGIHFRATYIEEGRALVRFSGEDNQFEARTVLEDELGDSFVVVQTLAPRTPGWMRSLGLQPMSLGLDLRGGVHFLYEVDMDAAIGQVLQNYEREFKTLLREEGVRYRSVRRDGASLRIVLDNDADRDEARRIINDNDSGVALQDSNIGGSPALRVTLTEDQVRQRQDFAIDQNTTTLRNRVNELGVAEPVVQRQGLDRIVVQLPGVQDPAQAERVLGATATLEFRLVDEANDPFEAERTNRAPLGSKLYQRRDGGPVLLSRDIIITGDQITDASSGFSEGQPAVFVNLDPKGGRRMGETTRANLERGMAVVFIEQKKRFTERNGQSIEEKYTEEEVISVATIRGVFTNRFQITGLTPIEARDLSLLLRAGSLAAPIYKVEERTVGPSLGQDNIDQGLRAVVIGFLLVVVFMLVYYRVFGVFANMALLVNVVMIVALLSMLQASLTLPGIAGIVLTVGMAVDANVLIFERIREELRNGNTPQAAIHAGYEKAFSSIADANITTLIAALVLWTLGTGPIRGFAVTLSLGIITSMFTAIVGTRAVVNLVYGGRRVEKLAI